MPYGMPNFWTDERVEQLKALVDGLSAAEIAREIGARSRNAVIGKLHRLGISSSGRPGGSRPKNSGGGAVHSIRKRVARKLGIDGATATNIKYRHASPSARPPRAAPPPVPETIEPRNIPFLARRMGKDCAFPTTDGSPWLCCGHPVAEGEYCAHHARRCFNGYGRPGVGRLASGSAGLGVSPKDHLRAGFGAAEAANHVAVQGDHPAHQSSEDVPWQS